MVDEDGYNRSAWALQSSIDSYCQTLGCSSIIKSSTADDNDYTNAINNSMYCVISTHGNKSGIEWSMRNVYAGHVNCTTSCTTCFGVYDTTDLNALSSNYFQGTRCVVLMACSTVAGGKGDTTNFANALHSKGVATVVGFQEKIWTTYDATTLQALTDRGTQKWATEFTKLLSEGKNVDDAAANAYTNTITANLAATGYTMEQLNSGDIPPDVLTKKIYCGLNSYCIIGDEDQVLKY